MEDAGPKESEEFYLVVKSRPEALKISKKSVLY